MCPFTRNAFSSLVETQANVVTGFPADEYFATIPGFDKQKLHSPIGMIDFVLIPTLELSCYERN